MKWYEKLPPELDVRRHETGSRHIPTNDDWYPTYDDGTVVGGVHVLSSLELRICFWGNDDCGMELDMPLTIDDYERWNKWLSQLSYIDMDTLLSLGFQWA